ncbi:unnamed protein product [Ostreobium quekettii]|uniref:Uncharacterized protein n=1 Tax=Ostreobium quekettii TaxID=121088 RepID=A0A8S1IXR4_9CHLO|nr:unnamed protein product [Ostreobium quekettii]
MRMVPGGLCMRMCDEGAIERSGGAWGNAAGQPYGAALCFVRAVGMGGCTLTLWNQSCRSNHLATAMCKGHALHDRHVVCRVIRMLPWAQTAAWALGPSC